MKLITEEIKEFQVITEKNEEGKKDFFIEGIFLQADIKNRNGRMYPKQILVNEVQRYAKDKVGMRNAYGELGHPKGPTINPDRISHLVTELKEEGSNFIGKAKIMPTPMGNIARNIMEAGGALAVSSRGMGTLKSVGGVMQVQEDFHLATAADIVVDPSAPDAYVEGILEGVEYFYESGLLREKTIENMVDDAVVSKTLDEQFVLSLWEKLLYSIK